MTELAEHERDDAREAVRASADFDAFFRREYRSAVALAYALSGSRLAAEDLAQEAFLAAQRQWATVGGYDRPAAWVRRVVANRSVSTVRRRMAEVRALSRLRPLRFQVDPLPGETASIWRAVRRLPRRQAQVVALRYLEDMTFDEIGRLLSVGPETARTHLRRAHEALRRTPEIRSLGLEE